MLGTVILFRIPSSLPSPFSSPPHSSLAPPSLLSSFTYLKYSKSERTYNYGAIVQIIYLYKPERIYTYGAIVQIIYLNKPERTYNYGAIVHIIYLYKPERTYNYGAIVHIIYLYKPERTYNYGAIVHIIYLYKPERTYNYGTIVQIIYLNKYRLCKSLSCKFNLYLYSSTVQNILNNHHPFPPSFLNFRNHSP